MPLLANTTARAVDSRHSARRPRAGLLSPSVHANVPPADPSAPHYLHPLDGMRRGEGARQWCRADHRCRLQPSGGRVGVAHGQHQVDQGGSGRPRRHAQVLRRAGRPGEPGPRDPFLYPTTGRFHRLLAQDRRRLAVGARGGEARGDSGDPHRSRGEGQRQHPLCHLHRLRLRRGGAAGGGLSRQADQRQGTDRRTAGDSGVGAGARSQARLRGSARRLARHEDHQEPVRQLRAGQGKGGLRSLLALTRRPAHYRPVRA